MPAVLKQLQEAYRFSVEKIIRALATAGLIGNLVKTNGSIAGAEVGCQGEIGTACAAYALLSDGRHKISFDDVVQTLIMRPAQRFLPARVSAVDPEPGQ
ncbi:unnamed protein product [marine sediment metagenome]|uniref:Serine dehydratase-like alpha subunit domain-containing protein n=1 Tax=marine sediment metagenome TaxID=412755 RepID=X0YEP7_9ZZZZ